MSTDSRRSPDSADVARLVEVLLEKRVELRQRVAAINADVRQPLSPDFAEQGVELENADVLAELGREAIEELGRINMALARIDNGSYGACASCGEAIEPGRLTAVPWALRCLACEKQHMEAQVAGRPRKER